MLTRSHIPAPPLSQFIELLWYYQGYAQPHHRERLLPQGSAEFVFNLDEDQVRIYDRENDNKYETLSGSIVSGPHSQYFVIDTTEQRSVLGVHFKPGGLFPFIGLPAIELQNLHVSLEDIWGRAARLLRERLLAAATPEAMFAILEQALLARAAGRFDRHPAVGYALHELECAEVAPSVADVTAKIGLSARRFSQIFGEEVGLAPKLYSRVQRFQNVLRIIGPGRPLQDPPRIEARPRELDWIEIALSCGYYDQAHFIHDFREFSGMNPTVYTQFRTDHQNHVPLHD